MQRLRLFQQFKCARLFSTTTNVFQQPGTQLLSSLHHSLLSLKPIAPNDTYVSCTILNEKGDVTAVSQKFPKLSFLRQHELYPRDLRKIDTSSVEVVPSLLVKSNCIILNMLYIKALICKDKVYVFDTANLNSAVQLGVLMYDLESKLSLSNKSLPNHMNAQYYEHKALESMLINVMSALETEFTMHSELCGHILSELENEVNRDKLRDLLIKSKNLTSFYQKSLLIREVLDETLENNEDLASMYLTSKRTEHDDFADLEMLLETYYTQCDEYVQRSDSLLQDIKSTEEIVNIILDANRNSLMLMELKVTIYTLGFTVATLIPAFCGMNLKNFIEESDYGFGGVVLVSLIGAIWITRANFRSLRSVTRLTMLNNHTGAYSTRHKQIAKALTDQQVPSLWQKIKYLFFDRWSYKEISERPKIAKERREMIWKWLIEEDKKD